MSYSHTTEKSTKIVEYAKYIESHRTNVAKAWEILKKACVNMDFIYDDTIRIPISENIAIHDLSKYSQFEFIQYQEKFFPSDTDDGVGFEEAWEHHKKHNKHHWQRIYIDGNIEDVVEMVCDWMAMSMQFGGTAEEYYLENKNNILLQDWQLKVVTDVFNAISLGE